MVLYVECGIHGVDDCPMKNDQPAGWDGVELMCFVGGGGREMEKRTGYSGFKRTL